MSGNLSNHRAQVPGYCGYIPGKYSENKFGATFAEVSKGSYPTQQESFLTTNIANNTFIQQQHPENKFWTNSGALTAFKNPDKQAPIRNIRQPIQSNT